MAVPARADPRRPASGSVPQSRPCSVTGREARPTLEGATDEGVAAALSLSLWTVKKRWQVVYGRVGGAVPEPRKEDAQASARGPERRRHLINYLRDRLEELRP